MEKRKIQKVGSTTLTVSLPKNWTNLEDVKPGDTVYLDQSGNGTLWILSEKLFEKEHESKEYSINCDQLEAPNLLERLVVGCYIQGVDTITLFSPTRIVGKNIEDVRNISQRLIGLDIIEMSEKEIILQCFIDPMKFQLHSLIQRLSIIASTMFNEAMKALLELNLEFAGNVLKREKEANNLYWLITRLSILARHSRTMTPKKDLKKLDTTDVRFISKNLEIIADCSSKIAEIVYELQRNRNKIDSQELQKISSLTPFINEIYQKAIDSIFLDNILMANDAINKSTKLETEVEAKTFAATTPYSRAIGVMLAVIAENIANIAALAFNIEILKNMSE